MIYVDINLYFRGNRQMTFEKLSSTLSEALRLAPRAVRRGCHYLDTRRLSKQSMLSRCHKVHLSLDDVHQLFVSACETNPKSIFDLPLLSRLQALHELYGARFTLYCFEDEAYRLPQKYCDELIQCSWLRLGYHADRNGEVSSAAYQTFVRYYRSTGLKMADTLRSHWFRAPPDVIAQFHQDGVKRLLCADDGRVSYGISGEQYKDGISVKGIEYIPTDIRLERHNVAALLKKEIIRQKSDLVIFSHEIVFLRYSLDCKLKQLLQLMPRDVEYEL